MSASPGEHLEDDKEIHAGNSGADISAKCIGHTCFASEPPTPAPRSANTLNANAITLSHAEPLRIGADDANAALSEMHANTCTANDASTGQAAGVAHNSLARTLHLHTYQSTCTVHAIQFTAEVSS